MTIWCHGHREAVRWGPLVEGDLADRALAGRDDLRAISIAAVMHFAAFAYVGESVEQPELYFRNNVVNSLGLLEAMLDAGVQAHRLLLDLRHLWRARDDADPRRHAAAPGQSLWREQAHGRAHAPLARRGARAPHVGAALFQRRRRRSRGRDRRGPRARDPSHPADPRRRARPARAQIDVFGTDYPTPDGTAIRDYIHVQDLAEAHVQALRYLEAGGDSVALNLGTGEGHSVREIIAAAERVTGRPIPRRETAPRRAGRSAGAGRRCDARAPGCSGWTPALSALDDIIATAWAWHQRRHAAPDTRHAAPRR